MRKRRGLLGPLLLLLLLFNIAHALLSELAQRLSHPGAGGLALVDEALRRENADAQPQHGSVHLLASGRRLESRALIADAGARGPGYFVLDIDGESRATASAMGLDFQQYIVNAYLVGFMPYHTNNLWEPLLTLAQRKRYQFDHLQYRGQQDVWQSSAQAFARTRGDCEDHALALADWLIGLGEDARVVVGTWRGGGHAWVVLFKGGQEYLFEATQKQGLSPRMTLPLARHQVDYRPSYMFNRDHFWSNEGTPFTTRYSGRHWRKKSRYLIAQENS